MTTISILDQQLTISEELSDAFLEYYAYYSLPTKVKMKIDPKCKQHQWLYDDFVSSLRQVFEDSFDNLSDEDYDRITDQFDDLDFDSILDQFEQTLLTETN